ncbi:MFS transporter [Saccharomonospora xinjiangensis]|uniref:Arabinose efflux permease family protein n=1 Tax=Saccharomonospora xinjiangensis XJ-54 TaxID=882086 RepID=I0V474_9PSEU|nr:MFS transporter [Saccharomonospora xinjiangensis]EID54927.1 arabinose efflux permease family protein [Saccharomonospora xinjiangensis XJ-54]
MRSGRRGRRKWTPDERASRTAHDPARGRRSQPPPATRAYPPGGAVPTADEAPTGAVPTQPVPPPARGARPYSARATPPPWRSQRAEPPYEHYDTGGYAPGQPRESFDSIGRSSENHRERQDREDTATTRHGFEAPQSVPRMPKKLTVTRVAALRSRELSGQAVAAFRRAAAADGADKSGLTSLTYAVMLNYASDAAMAVALANTLFFAASSGESRGKVALYLLITIAPFALVAPVIGPALDRIQRGRRLAMAIASAGQALMCVIMALNFDTWALYPAALGKMVLSKSFMVLKAAVTPRVLPPEITLSKTNARLAVFGLAAGGAFGAVASGLNWAFGSAGALWFTALICVAGAVQAMRIPSWVEVTEGEVPAALTGNLPTRGADKAAKEKRTRQPMARHVVVALWGNGSIRVLTGFLMMFAAFAVKAETEGSGQSAFVQLLLLGVIGAAAGLGGFLGNALGSRMHFGKSDQVVLVCLASALTATIIAALLSGIATAALVGLVGSTASALAKNSLDAVIQQDMPEESRASAFGRSETVLQLAWVSGGAVGLLLPPTYWIGFLVVSALLALGLAQTWLVRGGSSLLPSLRRRAARPGPEPQRSGS